MKPAKTFTDMYHNLLAYLDADYRRPLPSAKAAEQWFTQRRMFGNVTPAQKRVILGIVFDEIRKSREAYVPPIEDRHVYKEEWFYLYIINCGGGFEGLRAVGFEGVIRRFVINEHIFFRNTNAHYFEQGKGRHGPRLKYKRHLEAIRTRVVNEIFTTEP